MSILYKSTPDQVRLILVDPKRLELGNYEGIPHLLTEIITEPKKAAYALRNAVREMERRLKLLAEKGVRNIDQYNKLFEEDGTPSLFGEDSEEKPIPYIVIIIDELADLMMLDGNNVEESVTRLAQMARAVGIHLVLATQRPSVDVITGLIKANFPARISFRVATKVDSRTILDANGAESLLGRGDMMAGNEQSLIMRRARAGEFRLLYLSPERLARPDTLDWLRTVPVAFFAIDEAHCISEWGHEFRPEYRQLSRLRQEFPDRPIAAFTASATRRVRHDILQQLQLRDPHKYIASFHRPNLRYVVKQCDANSQTQLLVRALKDTTEGNVIVYSPTIARVEETVDMLVDFLKHRVDLDEVNRGIDKRKEQRDRGKGCGLALWLAREQRGHGKDNKEQRRECQREIQLTAVVELRIPANVEHQGADKG